MATKTRRPNRTMQAWIDARQRHSLSHAQVQMARGLGMNPANRLVKHYECLTCSHTWQQPNHPESPAGWRMVEDEHKCVACRRSVRKLIRCSGSGRTVVVPQQPAQPVSTADLSPAGGSGNRVRYRMTQRSAGRLGVPPGNP